MRKIDYEDILHFKAMCGMSAETNKMFNHLAYSAAVDANLVMGVPDGTVTYDERAVFTKIVDFCNNRISERCKSFGRTYGIVFDVRQLAENVSAGIIGLACYVRNAGETKPYIVDIHFDDEYDKDDFEDYANDIFRVLHLEKGLDKIRYI